MTVSLQCPKINRRTGNACRGRMVKAGFVGNDQRYQCTKCHKTTIYPIKIKRKD